MRVGGSKGRLVAAAPSFPTSLDTNIHCPHARRGGTLARVQIPDRFLSTHEVGIDATTQIPPAYPMALSMNALVRAIEGKAKARPDFDQARQVERVLEAVRRSAAQRR